MGREGLEPSALRLRGWLSVDGCLRLFANSGAIQDIRACLTTGDLRLFMGVALPICCPLAAPAMSLLERDGERGQSARNRWRFHREQKRRSPGDWWWLTAFHVKRNPVLLQGNLGDTVATRLPPLGGGSTDHVVLRN